AELALQESRFRSSSLCNLCVLCAFVVKNCSKKTTTETQRTQRLHREELRDRLFVQGWIRIKIRFMAQAKKAISKTSGKLAARNAARAAVKTYQNYINGEWVGSQSGEMFENINPADNRDIVGRFPLSTSDDVNAAVNAAQGAFDRWRNTPAPKRAEILFRLGEILIENKEQFTADMTREMGKVLKEAGGDVQEAIDCTYYTAGEGRRLHGFTSPAEMRDKFAMCVRQPVGLCGLITPWNFPMAIPSWKLIPALVCGNTVVIKPA